eukprot:superscaffoldBa00000540_g5507
MRSVDYIVQGLLCGFSNVCSVHTGSECLGYRAGREGRTPLEANLEVGLQAGGKGWAALEVGLLFILPA